MARLYFQLHVHSDRSHDSSTSIEEFVNYFEKFLGDKNYGVISFTDHNTVPLSMEEAIAYSTNRVLVLPGIQWKIRKTYWDAISKLCTRREIITIGDHDDLSDFLVNHSYKTNKTGEILGNLTEDEFLEYISKQKQMILIVPHPKHFIVDYYGPRQIRALRKKIKSQNIKTPFLVEEKTGYDPFPRLMHSYAREYPIVYASDAHEIRNFLGTDSFHSTEMYLDDVNISWGKDSVEYKKAMINVLKLLQDRNKDLVLSKHYLPSVAHFLRSIPAWVKRRFNDFPRNLLR